MIDNPLGTAMKLDDGTLSVIVPGRWKDSLTDYLSTRRIEFNQPTRLNLPSPYLQYEIIVRGATEHDFREWSADLMLILK